MNVSTFIIFIFSLWMNKGGLILFTIVINFLTLDWGPKHITIGLFEVKGIIRIGFARPNYRFFF